MAEQQTVRRIVAAPMAAVPQIVHMAGWQLTHSTPARNSLLHRDGSLHGASWPNRQDEQRRFCLLSEYIDPLPLGPEQSRNYSGTSVADVEPDNLWRKSLDVASLAEVGVFGHNGEAFFASVVPDPCVFGAAQANISDVKAIGILFGELSDQAETEVLVEE
jgi:hypothetical protein